ncbi:zinc finger protein CONSTANS-LIKE 6-like [Mangifera indica]|uniref:zinc finger protein CONSTANS-LIKE 6-like n=1 Tax=Mangifera indica TaxID=29780 RepID=UPI001CFB2FDD|nr:zinc finger protein CONSTANS-LIKE 6-like [Mangifera indica]
MISSNKNVANVLGGKTARACDSCVKKRARWYCVADDAFLCQACDSSVHSANPLARRHERVLLKTASIKSSSVGGRGGAVSENPVPSWHRGFTRKARTPRHGKSSKPDHHHHQLIRNPLPFVPEVGGDEISQEINEEEQLLYRVPIFDPFAAELCTSTNSNNEAEKKSEVGDDVKRRESKVTVGGYGNLNMGDVDSSHGFLPSDTELAEFAADVENLLGRGFQNESFSMEELGLMDYKEKDIKERCLGNSGKVKVEEEEKVGVNNNECRVENEIIDMEREPFELNFDYDEDSPSATCTGEKNEKIVKKEFAMETSGGIREEEDGSKMKKKRKILLSLNYEAVITAWASQGSPWTSGSRPEFDPDECWPDCMGGCGSEIQHSTYVDMAGFGTHPAMADGGREARVLRYREKRRTRLFSKKIRYEVRKLNAEKRPRMKGRFVKRASFAGGPQSFPLFKK